MSTNGNRAPVATHHTLPPNCSSATRVAPAAAGLRMCRPRQAMKYLDAVASTPARASVVRSRGSRLGQNRKNRIRPVMIDDSVCGRVRRSRANIRLDRIVAPRATARLARSSVGVNGRGGLAGGSVASWNSEKPTAAAATTLSARVTSRYMVTRPVKLSRACFTRTPLHRTRRMTPPSHSRTSVRTRTRTLREVARRRRRRVQSPPRRRRGRCRRRPRWR